LKRNLKFAGWALLLALYIPTAVAQESKVFRDGGKWTQEITGSLGASRNLRVKVQVGSVRVEGGSQSGITYVIRSQAFTSSEQDARKQFGAYKINAYSKADTAWIVADWQGSRPKKFSGDFVIMVPRNMDWVKVETEGGSVAAKAITGRVDTQSGGGSIHLDDIGGQINSETGGGSIDVGTVGGEITLRTGGGSIKVASAKGKITAESGGGSVVVLSGMQGATLETGGGSIQVDRCNGQVRATTGGGSIDLGDIGGAADIDTGGGSIRLTSAKGPVHATTGGGSIDLGSVPSARAESGGGGIVAKFLSGGDRTDSTLETSAGDITVYLASDLNVTVRAAIDLANGHKIRSEFSDIQVRSEGGEWGPKTVTAEGKLNGGGPILKVRTSSGDIVFRRASQ
jgi:DUF4097 and DUF4098 domain-containing protein YvlB